MIHTDINNWKTGKITEGRAFVEPINFPTFVGNENYILGSARFWVVYVMASTDGTRFKSMSRDSENLQHLVNFILGGSAVGHSNEAIANEIAGIFEDEADALKFFDALDYRAES